jgi:SnoaL-like domain
MSRVRRAGLTIKNSRTEGRSIVPANDPRQLARESYHAFAAGERGFFEEHLSGDFTFSSPPDPQLDRDGRFARCWPGAGWGQEFEFVRLVESGDEVVVTYELRRPDGTGGRNTEILTFLATCLTEAESERNAQHLS